MDITHSSRPAFGLHQIFPPRDAREDNTTLDVIAIHGLDTKSPHTWEYDHHHSSNSSSRKVNWLSDPDMLPSFIPHARVYTYDWDANCFENAPVQNLFGHADTLLAAVAEMSSSSQISPPTATSRPIIFVASCFGGLVLAEAITRAHHRQEYRSILRHTVGCIFLATPFYGSDAATPARWLTVVRGATGSEASDSLISDLEKNNDLVWERVQSFTKVVNSEALRLPVTCFYETYKTEMLKKLIPGSIAKHFYSNYTKVMIVSKSSACPAGFFHQALSATHGLMNKFPGPDCPNFRSVKGEICRMAEKAENVLSQRQLHEDYFVKPSQAQQTLDRLGTFLDSCQKVAVNEWDRANKTKIALNASLGLRKQDTKLSVKWVPAVSTAIFDSGYRAIGRQLGLQGTDS